MSNLVLIEGTGNNTKNVKAIAREHGFEIREENLELCVIKHNLNDRIVAVLGFNSDAGTDYHEKDGLNFSLEHELLYMEPQSFVSKDDSTILDELADITADWIYRYLLKSAIASIAPCGSNYGSQVFVHRVKGDVDNIMLWSMRKFKYDLFAGNLDVLGYKNKQFM